MEVTVGITTIPDRITQLTEALTSVYEQTRTPDRVLVSADLHRRGPAYHRNLLVGAADTEWFTFLDDDDVMFPHHLETLCENAGGVDVVWCYGSGFYRGYRIPFDPDVLRNASIVPITAMFRRSLWEKVGGFPERRRGEDWGFWNRLLDAGARFRSVSAETWEYRRHGNNLSFGEL